MITAIIPSVGSPRIQGLPIQSAEDIPTTFPRPEEYDHLRATRPDAFLMFAGLKTDRFIRNMYWSPLTQPQQQYVRDSLASRGLTLFDRGDGMVVTESEYIDSPAHAYCMSRDRFEFMVDDGRVYKGDCIVLTVMNVDTKSEARQILRKFLKLVHECGLDIF